MCRRALPFRPRHGFKRHPPLPGPSPAEFLREVGPPGLTPLTTAPGDLPLPPGPTSTAPGRRRRPRPSCRGAIGQPGRHSGGRALPTPPSLPLHPPSQEKRRLGQGGSQRQAGSSGMRSGEHRKKRAGQARGGEPGRPAPRGQDGGAGGGPGVRRGRGHSPPPPRRAAGPVRTAARRARPRAGRGVEEKRGEGRARPGPLCKAPVAAAAATAPWQR